MRLKKSTPLREVKECFSGQRYGDVIADKNYQFIFDFLF